jgi:hypothetical protein
LQLKSLIKNFAITNFAFTTLPPGAFQLQTLQMQTL